MKNYIVKIEAPLPYPVVRAYRETASRMAVAVKRAIDKYRKEHKRKMIKELSVKVTRLD